FVHSLAPLRERKEDIGVLIADILRGTKVKDGGAVRFAPAAARALLRYDWPSNVRELEQCLAASSVLAEEALIGPAELPQAIAYWADAPPPSMRGESPDDDDVVRRELVARFVEARGNMSDVARAMGKARQQIQRWALRFGIDPQKYREP